MWARLLPVILCLFPAGDTALAQSLNDPRALSGGDQRELGRHVFSPPFEVVDELQHQDDFWKNSLVGDANHNGRQEIVLRVPERDGINRIVFYEDDGTGVFDEVYSFPLPDGGLLALGDIDRDGLADLFLERVREPFTPNTTEFVRMESSSRSGFPDHVVWTHPKKGSTIDGRATIADVDGDGLLEFVTTDSPIALKVFESRNGNHLDLISDLPFRGDLGNPVVADFDLDGRAEIAVAGLGSIFVFETTGNNSFRLASRTSHLLTGALNLALIPRRHSPDHRPMLFLAGRVGTDNRVRAYESFEDDALTLVNDVSVPNGGAFGVPEIYAADLVGTKVSEIVLADLAGPVPIYSVGKKGALKLLDSPFITESAAIVATCKTRNHSGALAVGTIQTFSNPVGSTLVLEATTTK